MRAARVGLVLAIALTQNTLEKSAFALDKQGAAHGGAVEEGGDPNAFDVTGALIGRKLSFPLDLNLFTDKTRHGA